MKKTQKGFTLIELLVVIAIIGILATIILASLGDARSKANDAKVQDQLSSMRAQAELFYTNVGNYGTVGSGCGSSGPSLFSGAASTDSLITLLAGIPAGYTTNCYTSGTSAANAWAVTSENSTSTTAWCADSNGDSKVYTSTTTPAVTGTIVNTSPAVCD